MKKYLIGLLFVLLTACVPSKIDVYVHSDERVPASETRATFTPAITTVAPTAIATAVISNPHQNCLNNNPETWESACVVAKLNKTVTSSNIADKQVIHPSGWEFVQHGNILPLSVDKGTIRVILTWSVPNSSYAIKQTIKTELGVCYLVKMSLSGELWYTQSTLNWIDYNYNASIWVNQGTQTAVSNQQGIEPLIRTLTSAKDKFYVSQDVVWAVKSTTTNELTFETGISATFGIAKQDSYLDINDIQVIVAPNSYCVAGGYIEY